MIKIPLKYLLKAVIALPVLLALTCCRTTEKVVVRTVVDSMIVERVKIDTVVSVSADTAMARALFECDSAGNVLMAELASVQGQRVGVSPEVRYVVRTDSSTGRKYRVAYMKTVAVADSLALKVQALNERLTHVKSETNSKSKTRKPLAHNLFFIGLIFGAAGTLVLRKKN